MKNTDIDIKDLVFKIIRNSDIPAEITGKVYKDQRPINSQVEDVVISVLAGSASQVQTFTVNVNVYVADIMRGNEPIEHTVRLRQLCRLCFNLFDFITKDNFILSMEAQRVFKVDGINFHCINNRLEIRIINS